MATSVLPGRFNIEMYAGDTFGLEVLLLEVDNTVDPATSTPTDVSAGSWDSQIRVRPDAPGDPIATFTITPSVDTDGLLQLDLDSAVTGSLGTSRPRKLAWDLQHTLDTGEIRTVLYGDCIIKPEVTQ